MTRVITQQTSPNLKGSQASPEFDGSLFNQELWKKGYYVIREKAIACPCRQSEESGSALSDCQNCRGTGWVFIDQVETKALTTSINKNTEYKDWSVENIGTIACTFLDKENISFMDRITFKNSHGIYTETRRLRTQTEQFIFLSYKPESIEDVYIFNGSGNNIIRLEEGTDFDVSNNNGYVLTFSHDFSQYANFNDVISIRYTHELQYHILDIPHNVRKSPIWKNRQGREQQQNLPLHYVARLAHNVLTIPDFDGSGILNNDTT